MVHNVNDGAFTVGSCFSLVDAIVFNISWVEDVVGVAIVIGEDEGFWLVDKVLGDSAVDDGCDGIAILVGVAVSTNGVGFLRVDDGLPSAISSLDDPCLIRVGLPGVELTWFGRDGWLVVPGVFTLVLHSGEVWLVYGDIEGEFDVMVEWHFAFIGGAHSSDFVGVLVPVD